MEIKTRDCAQWSSVAWTEVTVVEDNTIINFDVRGQEKLELARHLADTAFDLMPDIKTIFEYIEDRGLLHDIVSMATDSEGTS